jgi:hypothetical protein
MSLLVPNIIFKIISRLWLFFAWLQTQFYLINWAFEVMGPPRAQKESLGSQSIVKSPSIGFSLLWPTNKYIVHKIGSIFTLELLSFGWGMLFLFFLLGGKQSQP